uniref:Peptidase M14 domain-containing protein n=1 Tax=Anopheles atroparvus TaxID=41427 RepID=A0AAG5DCV8_ANOAO
MGCWDLMILVLLVGVIPNRQVDVLAVNGIYVNNQKIEKFEADRIKLLHPARPSPATHQPAVGYVGKDELLTKDNFTNAQHYYQYLVRDHPASYIDLLWGRNKTHFPSLFRVDAPVSGVSLPASVHLDDEQSTFKNTLNNSTPVYVGDYQRVQLPAERPVFLSVTSTRAPIKPSKRFKKRPKPKPSPSLPQVLLSPTSPNATLSPETLALLSRFYSFSCTLTPKQRTSQLAQTTTETPTTTRKLKTHRPTTRRPPSARPTTPSPDGKRKKTVVYVDPPVINRIGGVLESVYDFMENALTSTEYVADSKERGGDLPAGTQKHARGSGGAKVKRNVRNITTAISDILSRFGDTSGSAAPESTRPWVATTSTSITSADSSSESSKRFTPERVTISGVPVVVSDGNKNKMTTNIQVTSEYTAATPPTFPLSQLSSRAARGTPETYDDYDDGGDGRSTTPRVLDNRRRPTRSTSNGFERPATQIERDPDVASPVERSPWLSLPPAYLFNEVHEDDALEVPVLEVPVPPTPESPASGTSSGWFDLMMPWDFFNPWTHDEVEGQVQDTVKTTPVAPIAMATPEPTVEVAPTSEPAAASNWLSQFFVGAPMMTTTATPPKKTPRPEQLLSALVQYLVQATPSARPSVKPKRRKSYAGYQLWRVAVQNDDQLQRLGELQHSPEGLQLQWWSGPSLHEPTDVLVPPGAAADSLRDYLLEEGMQYQPSIGDLGRAIAFENPRMTRRDQIETELLHGHPLTWYRYHRYADIVKFLDYLGRRHSQHVRLLHIGRSYEGRPLTVVRVSFAPSTRRRSAHKLSAKKRRPSVFIMAGAHGNQWIGPAVATWLLQRLLDASNSSEVLPELETVRSYDWYVLPVANPDGYEYSHEHDRMWSKSRSRPDHRPPPGFGQALLTSALSWWNTQSTATRHPEARPEEACYGVDLDHNWAYRWQDTSGSSRSECSTSYAGPAAFSEPETRAVRDFLHTGRRNVRIFLSLQAYGQSLRYPPVDPTEDYGSAMRLGAHAYGDVHEMAAVGLEAMRGAGGELPYTLERSEGGATASGYARFAAGVRYSYTLRLPDTGTHGFLLPPSNIASTGRDTFELVKGMMDYS